MPLRRSSFVATTVLVWAAVGTACGEPSDPYLIGPTMEPAASAAGIDPHGSRQGGEGAERPSPEPMSEVAETTRAFVPPTTTVEYLTPPTTADQATPRPIAPDEPADQPEEVAPSEGGAPGGDADVVGQLCVFTEELLAGAEPTATTKQTAPVLDGLDDLFAMASAACGVYPPAPDRWADHGAAN